MVSDSPTDPTSNTALVSRRALSVLVFIWIIVLATLTFAIVRQRGTPLAHSVLGLDPNVAPWWELAALPEIGESTAREIVRHRDAVREKAKDPNRQVFRRAADLDAVKGIGPKTVQRIAPHLRFPRTANASEPGTEVTGGSTHDHAPRPQQ